MDPKTLDMYRDLAVIRQGNAAKGLLTYLTRLMDQDSIGLRTASPTDAPLIAMLQGRSQRVIEIIEALNEAPSIVEEQASQTQTRQRPQPTEEVEVQ
jgi:hypothetical protein